MNALFENFGVDWKLLLAQVVNFFILFFILRRYAYGPIVKVLKDRERRIRKGLEDSAEAERKLSEAEMLEDEILKAAEKKSLGIVSHAEDIASKKQVELVEAAHRKAEQIIASGQKKLHEEREKQSEDVRRNAEELVLLATGKVLGKMEPTERDRELVAEALRELKTAASK